MAAEDLAARRTWNLGTGQDDAQPSNMPTGPHTPIPTEPPRVPGTAMAEGVALARDLIALARTEPTAGGTPVPRPAPSWVAILALALALAACLGVVGAAVIHEVGNANYETAQAEANTTQTQAMAELARSIDRLADANATLQTGMAALTASDAKQQKAIYGLIDALSDTIPKVAAVERDLKR